jgi:uncharacterized protein (TIGR02246 family)
MMRCAAFVVAVALLAGGPAAGQASAPTLRTSTDTLTAWREAFNSRDPKRIVALYAPTAVFWGTTAKTIARTPEELWAYFKDAGQRPLTRVAFDSTNLRVMGDVAIASGAYTFSDVKDGVASNVRPSRYTFVFRKFGDSWLIVDHHSSRVPEP